MAVSIPIRQSAYSFEDMKHMVLPRQASANIHDNTVLSFSFEKDLLPRREAALRSVGYNVFSTTSEACVRFEIQMGQCGVLLLCYTIPDMIRRDLVGLFERHCHSGVIASVMHPFGLEDSPRAGVCLLDSDFPQKLDLIEEVRINAIKAHESDLAGFQPG